ncbi:hypothetical protein K501DRAFT_316446 [Backusella circina FSU 941]|nr:hypothetical protein K501DRAFT_316446 [Backusella circina FSU 941]
MLYEWHKKLYDDVFAALHISSTKSTHASRKSVMSIMFMAVVSGDQQSLAGRWVTHRRLDHYTATLPIEALKNDYDYFLSRAEVLSPRELQLVVFPKVDYCIESSNNMDNVEEDKSDPFFLNLLQELRTVFLQTVVYTSYVQ